MIKSQLIFATVMLSAAFQFVAAYMAVRLIRPSGGMLAWVLLAGSFVVMGIRRVVTLFHLSTGISRGDLTAEILALLISLLIMCGIKMIQPLFARMKQSAMELEQRVAERTEELEINRAELASQNKELQKTLYELEKETGERIRAMEQLRIKDRILVHQSRLAAMGEMIGNIAHQWRQPLNMLGLLVQDFSMTYKKGAFSLEYLDENVEKMLKTIRHMSKTIDDFMYFFRPSKEKENFRILETIEKSLSLLEGSLKAQQIRTTVVSTCDPVVNGYPNEFSQVLINIMMNARDAFDTQDVVSPAITIEIGEEEGRCVVTITDNAGGIPEEIIDKIFDPYFTTKGPNRGTGVGLYMSKMIIENNMGGSLSAHNVDGGTQIRIVI